MDSPDWTSVDDALPTEVELVWANDEIEGTLAAWRLGGTWWTVEPGGLEGDQLYHVTHWMPYLTPPPPEE